MIYDVQSLGLLTCTTMCAFNIYFLVTKTIHAYNTSRTYFFPHVLQAKAYFSVSGRWLLIWALRFPLDTNPLRQCSHLNGRLSSGRWCIICLSYVSSLASSFPHSWHLKSQTYLWKEWHNYNLTNKVSMMPNIVSHCLSIFWNVILLLPYIKAWNIKELQLVVQLYHAELSFNRSWTGGLPIQSVWLSSRKAWKSD